MESWLPEINFGVGAVEGTAARINTAEILFHVRNPRAFCFMNRSFKVWGDVGESGHMEKRPWQGHPGRFPEFHLG